MIDADGAALPTFSLTERDFVRFRDLVRRKSGIEIGEARRLDLDHVVAQMLAARALPDAEAYYQLLNDPAQGQAAAEALVTALTVGETHFFRSRQQFDALAKTILPDLIARRRESRRLRLWSVGCASGEEPYSLAILLERLLPDLKDWNIRILATDINPQALEKARRGLYRPWSFREVPPLIQARYFTERDGLFEIAPRLRERVTFAYLNLVDDSYPSLRTKTQAIDLILCRNVFIYFNYETITRVSEKLYSALTDPGWLILGHSDPPQAIFHKFASHSFAGTVVHQKDTSAGSVPVFGAVTPPLAVRQPPNLADRVTAKTEPLPQTRPLHLPSSPAAQTEPLPQTRPLRPSSLPSAKPPSSMAYGEAMALWDAGRFDEALPRLEALALTEMDDGKAASLAAEAYANRLQLEQAKKWIDVALNRNPLVASAHYLHGLILQEDGRPGEALDAMRRCVYVDPEFVLGHFALAGLQAQRKQPDRARKSLENVSRLLAGRGRDESLPRGDGLTAGRLLDLVAVQRELL